MKPVAQLIIFGLVLIIAFLAICQNKKENYVDPIWMNKKKMLDDYYPRAAGSIYGTFLQPWNMFSGYPSY